MAVTRIFELLDNYIQKGYQRDDALAAKVDGKWKTYSTQEYINYARRFALGLLALDLKKGDKVATISNNRPEWNFVDMGIAQTGAVHVPIYPTISEEESSYILKHSDAKILIVSDKALYSKLKTIVNQIPSIEKIYTFDEVEGIACWQEILALGDEYEDQLTNKLEERKGEIETNDLFSIIYTSGTTGKPKGVMLSHNNFITNFLGGEPALPLDARHRIISFLPLCHVYERLLSYLFQYVGIGIYYVENMGTIINDMKDIKADGFDTVPRLLERVYDRIISKGEDMKGLKRRIFFWAVNLGHQYDLNPPKNGWYKFRLKIADKLVFSKWREALGGQVKFIGCGGAALHPRLSRIFWAAGIPIQEGYGMTETSPLLAFNYPAPPLVKLGTVGPPLHNIKLKIDKDGEIVCKGPNVMLGYYKDPESTKASFDEDGWFHTGDIGEMIDGKYLKITDRKKSIFKISSGKYIAPQVIENRLKSSIFIEQAMVVGENEKFASALICPNFSYLHDWASERKVHYRDNRELVQAAEVGELYQKEVGRINNQLGKTEEIKRFRLVCEDWSTETGELSPTLKLRRQYIYDKYAQHLEDIYGHPHPIKGE